MLSNKQTNELVKYILEISNSLGARSQITLRVGAKKTKQKKKKTFDGGKWSFWCKNICQVQGNICLSAYLPQTYVPNCLKCILYDDQAFCESLNSYIYDFWLGFS